MTLTTELADANKGRWDMVEILLGIRHGDIEKLWPQAIEVALFLRQEKTDEAGQ